MAQKQDNCSLVKKVKGKFDPIIRFLNIGCKNCSLLLLIFSPFSRFSLIPFPFSCSMLLFRIFLCLMLLFIIFGAPCSRIIIFLLPAPLPILQFAPCSFVLNCSPSRLQDYPQILCSLFVHVGVDTH